MRSSTAPSGQTSRRPTARRLARAGLIAFTILLAGAQRSAHPVDQAISNSEAARIAHENALIKRQLDLASTQKFYLLLDPRAADLRIMLAGVTMARFAVERVEIGVPGGFSCRAPQPPRAWSDSVWTGAQIDPPRVKDRYEIRVDPNVMGPPPPPPVPLLPEEAYPMPKSYSILFDHGLALEISWPDTTRPEPLFKRLTTDLKDRYHALFLPQRDRLRVRLAMSLQDAAVLYRALPLNSSLLVMIHADEPPKR